MSTRDTGELHQEGCRGFIEQRYGYGAGRVPLVPAQRRPRLTPPSLAEGWREARRDGESPGDVLRRAFFRGGPAFAVATLLLAWLFAVVLAPRPDESEIQIVAFAPPPEVELPPEPEPVIDPLPEPEPLLEPEPIERAAPEPPQQPPEVEPPPRVQPPPPPKRPPPPRPQIQQLARPAPPTPEPKRFQRQKPTQEPAPAPRLALAALPAPDAPEPPPQPTRRSSRPFAAASPPDAKPRLDAPALRPAALPAAPAPESTRSPRRSAPPPSTTHAAPSIAPAASAPALPGRTPPPSRQTRRTPALPPSRRSGREQVALDVPDGSRRREPARPPPRPSRSAVARPAPAPVGRSRSDDPSLPGVPLASLAACVSDRTEDALKQKVVATVRNHTHCQSPAGRYHFVETKNVNAFLMRIERSTRRKPGDRCEELTLALDCLRSRSGGG